MMKFSNETLKNLRNDQRKDMFVFNINNNRFEVPLSYAIGISPYISEQYLKDPSFLNLVVKIENQNIEEEKIEEEFSKFIRGEEIREESFVKIGKILKNQEMIRKWKNTKEFTNERIIQYIKSIREINEDNNEKYFEDIQEEIEYIGKHLEEMKEEVKQMRDDEIIYILRNKDIRIEREDIIWDIIKERIREMKKEYIDKNKRKMRRLLLGNIKIKYLTEMNFKEFFEAIEFEDLAFIVNNSNRKENIWNQIQEILLTNINSINTPKTKIDEKERKVFEHKNGKDFEGIIKYLEDKYGKNIHQQGIITITASSTYYNKPEQVIDYNWDDHWNSNYQKPGEWWEINFRKMKVKVKGYSIKTFKYPANSYAHLKNWVVEGRNEGEEWKEIDRQDNYDLNGPSYQHYYSIRTITDAYQYIRFKCIGKNHFGNYYLILSNVELYGEIQE